VVAEEAGDMSCWVIVDEQEEIRAAGNTEGEAWLSFAGVKGTLVNGWWLFGYVEAYRRRGHRAKKISYCPQRR
jgi:hypothetical protein